MDNSFDFKYLPGCQFPVYSSSSEGYEDDCGMPAVALGWWDDAGLEVGFTIRLCQEHLNSVLKQEEDGKTERDL